MSKSFKEKATAAINPALAFISQPAAETEPEQDPPRPTATAPRAETKSRRLQVLIKPSTHERIKARALEEGISVNDWINKALERAAKAPLSESFLDKLLNEGEE